ncbi:methylcytosine dioxygenase TET [Anopheles cruzii]|uniref:methylcytosine dioxygenase TET n=1 Tax=Anopheles cruzii TaxID=68878 RepID=UPI0022EC714A|nr:methylcytosine dioxygenase TET [Anopheles cruzii]
MMVADFVTRQQNGSPLNGEIPGQNHHANSNMPAHSALLMSNNSSNSNSSGRASPHTSSESEFPQNGYELAAHLKRKELFSQRKQREFIPDNKKDDSYWDRRRRNNEAAKRSREKRRFNDMVLEQRVVELTKENHVLKAQLDAIKSKYNICGENLVSVDQIMATLPTNEQVLSSTKRVKLSNGGAGGRSTSPGGQSVSMFPLSRSPSRQRTASPTQSDPSGPAAATVEGGSPHIQLSQPSPTPSSQQAPVIHPNPNIESPPPQGGGLASPPVHSSTGAIQHTGSLPVHAIYRSIEYERGNGEVVHGKVSPPLTGRSPSQIRLELLERNLDLDHQHHHHHLHQHQQQLGQHGQQGQHHLQPHHHPLHHQLQPSHHHHQHQHQYGHHQHQREVIRESVIDHRGEHHHPGALQHHQLQQQQQQPQAQHIHHSNHHHRVLAANGGHELVVDDRDDRSPSPPAPSVARFGSPTTTTTTTASHAGSPPAATAATSSTSPSGSAGSPPAHLPLAAHSHHFPSHHHPHHPHHLHHPYVLGATSPYASSSSTSSPPASAAAVASLPASYTTVAAAAAVAAYAAGGLYGGSPPRHHPADLLSPSVALTLTANVLNLSRRAPSPYETAASGSGASPPRSASSGAEDEPDVGRDTGRELHEHANSLPVKLRHKSHLGDKDAASALLALQNIKQEPVGSLRSSSPSWDDGGDGGCSSDERDSGISTNEWPTKAEQKMMPASPPAAAAGSSSSSAGGGSAIASTAAMMAKITSIPASVVISKKTEENIHLQSKLARLESEVATIKNMMISSTAGSAFGVTAAAQ